MKTSIKGYYWAYAAAYAAVGSRFKESRRFSIQRSAEYKDLPYALIYYGNFT